ncbi:hypothetical protein [Puniceicoccus vermicola]|uniref:Uncharacterized protein n=1 Tax=Puniceicoccus vermicola TaxID=388746 RepID=A0A7X1B0K7_9BACT|nr:hypothetical protein [Puniceicoccus vermicola]MBC2603421.1 hypothetical protein [Puniceicoccus vermicola]
MIPRTPLFIAAVLLTFSPTGSVIQAREEASPPALPDRLSELTVSEYQQEGIGTASFRLQGEIEPASQNDALVVSARKIGSDETISVIRDPEEPPRPGGLQFHLRGNHETSYGFYRLAVSDGRARKDLGTIHWRHKGRSIQFISPEDSNHAYPPEIAS